MWHTITLASTCCKFEFPWNRCERNKICEWSRRERRRRGEGYDLEEDESFSLHPTLFPTLFHSGGICCTSPKLDILGRPVILYPWLPPIVPEPKEIELDSRALLRANWSRAIGPTRGAKGAWWRIALIRRYPPPPLLQVINTMRI